MDAPILQNAVKVHGIALVSKQEKGVAPDQQVINTIGVERAQQQIVPIRQCTWCSVSQITQS